MQATTRQCSVWLTEEMLTKLDMLCALQRESRSKALERLVAPGLETELVEALRHATERMSNVAS